MAIQNALNLTSTGIVSADGAGVFAGRTITGTTDFIDIADGTGVSGNPTASIATNLQASAMHSWNGAVTGKGSSTVASDGATITLSVELLGGGDLVAIFSDGFYDWDCTPADTVTLTAGTDASPQINYVYLLQSTKALTVSTTSWPSSVEHLKVAEVICQSAASLQTQAAYSHHQYLDDCVEATGQGNITDLTYWIRQQRATYHEGIAQTYTITPNAGAVDNVILTLALGEVLQLHENGTPAFSGTPDIYVINDSGTAYNVVTDLSSLLTDSTGASMSGKYFSLVIWMIVNQVDSECKLVCNLPSGSYNSASTVTEDASKYANYTIPELYVGNSVLISQWNLRHQTAANGTWTSIDELDLRGQFPVLGAGGSGAFPTNFIDSTFRIDDDADPSKQIAFQASGITTATTRTITMPDADITLLIPSNVAITGGAIDGTTIGATTPAAGTFDDLTLDDISGSYADAEQVFKQAGVQTTDATVTAAASITLATNTMVTVEARFNGFINDYSASCGGRIFYTARRVAGGAVEVGTPIVDVIEDSASAPTVDADVSGNDVRLLVTGVAAETWNWVVTYNYNFTKTNA